MSTATDRDFNNTFQIPQAFFGPTDKYAIVNVTITDDDVVEDHEVFELKLTISSSLQEIGITKGTPSIAQGVIVDDDG